MVRSTSRARLLYLLFSLLRSHAKHAPGGKKIIQQTRWPGRQHTARKKQQIDLKPPELKSVEVAVHKVHERLRECQPHRGARDIDPYIHDGRQDPGFADDFGFRVEPSTQARYRGADLAARAEDEDRLLANNCEHFRTWCLASESAASKRRRYRAPRGSRC